MTTTNNNTSWLKNILKYKIVIIITVTVLALGGYFYFTHNKGSSHTFVTVKRASISETVSVTGNTTPMQSVALSFGTSGIVSYVSGSLGDHVTQGQVLAQLNSSDAYAQISQAQANVDAQDAKLQGLQAGSRPEDIASAQAAADKAEQDIQNMYTGITDTSADSYAKANDAIRVDLDKLFLNINSSNPKLTYQTAYSQAQSDAEFEIQKTIENLNIWQTQLQVNHQSNDALTSLLQNGLSYLASINNLLQDISMTLYGAPGLDATTLAAYKANVSLATTEINTASKNLNGIIQNIASQKLIVSGAQAGLSLKKAGASINDIQAQQAAVQNAKASLQSAQSKLSNARLVAPMTGVITQFDAKQGQFALTGAVLVSIISDKKLEVDGTVPETDLGKLAVGNKVEITFDAFLGEKFNGTLSYIDPAATINQGVVNYKIKVFFDDLPSKIESGLTANLIIETRHKDNVLVLPQYAIVQSDSGTFAEILENNKVKKIPVVLGLQDQEGNVEIVSGVSEGQSVINIGLKT